MWLSGRAYNINHTGNPEIIHLVKIAIISPTDYRNNFLKLFSLLSVLPIMLLPCSSWFSRRATMIQKIIISMHLLKPIEPVHYKEWNILTQFFLKINPDIRGPQEEMQTVTTKSSCVTNVWHKCTKGEGERGKRELI